MTTNSAIQQLQKEVGTQGNSSKEWELLKHAMKSYKRVIPMDIQKTMFRPSVVQSAAITLLTRFHKPRMIQVIRWTRKRRLVNTYTVTLNDLDTDTTTVINDVLCYRKHVHYVCFLTAIKVYVIQNEEMEEFEYTSLKHHHPDAMDVYSNGSVLTLGLFSKTGLVWVQNLGNKELIYIKNICVFECLDMTVLDHKGSFLIRENFLQCIHYHQDGRVMIFKEQPTELWGIASLSYLWKTDQWCVQYDTSVVFTDTSGLEKLFSIGRFNFIRKLDEGFVHGMHINRTSNVLSINEHHTICIYEYRRRVCIAQLTFPFALDPTTPLQGMRECFEYIVGMVYYDIKHEVIIFTTKCIYTFSMFPSSFTHSTSTATTLE
jgi:hypothetical protein